MEAEENQELQDDQEPNDRHDMSEGSQHLAPEEQELAARHSTPRPLSTRLSEKRVNLN
jgi:hypothetical protein